MASSAWYGIVEGSRASVHRPALIITERGFEPKSASARAGWTAFGRPVWTSSLTPAKDRLLSSEPRPSIA